MTDALDTMTAAAVVERQKLQRHFGRFDILFFLICTIVGVDTIATVAQGGGGAFTWMMIFAVVFFVPQTLLFAELGAAFPQEAGPYYWTRLAFGHLAGAVNNFLYWITNPVWIGGSLTISCIGAVEVFFNHGNSVPTLVWYVIALAFVWLSILAAITSFSVGKWLPTAGAMARFLLLGLFTISVIIFAVRHGAHGLGASSYSPTAGGFVLLVGVLLFNFVGFELPNSAGEEMTNPQRDVPFAIARSGVASVVLCALPVIGILLVLPTSAITNFSGFISAILTVFTVYGGHVAADGTATLSGAGLCPRRRLRDLVHLVPADLRGDLDHAARTGRASPCPATTGRGAAGARRVPGPVEAAPQPPGHAPPVPDARLPAADRHPDGPGGHRQRAAHRARAGQVLVRQ